MESLQETILSYYREGMPFCDLVDVEEEVLRGFAEHAAFLRENVKWCRALPEDIFMENVAAYRINNEWIEDCRKWFFGMVWQEIMHMEEEEAILAVNMWCARMATYHQASARTANAVTVYKSGFGRCGEESVFAVTVLRSVGIAARQVYAPWWAHCDDNHAWVEVWCHGGWHYLGACEPEPVLDQGWFSYAASRAVLVHARCFGLPRGEQQLISRRGSASFINVTDHYGDTAELVLEILDEEGNPLKDTRVYLEVPNYGAYQQVAALTTDSQGKASIRMGKGEILVACSLRGEYFSCPVMVQGDGEIKARLKKPVVGEAVEYEFHAPVGKILEEPAPDPAWEEKLEQAKQCRQKRLLGYFDEKRAAAFPEAEELLKTAAGNFGQIAAFLETDGNPYRLALLKALEEKDLYDVKASLLEEHLQEASPYGDRYPEEIFVKYLLNPRVGSEELSCYRKGLKAYLGEDAGKYREHPALIWTELCLPIPGAGEREYRTLQVTPLGALKGKCVNEDSRKLLFVAVCRSLGIPARLNPVCHMPEYYRDGAFHLVAVQEEAPLSGGKLLLSFKEKREWKYFSTWTLSQWMGDSWKVLGLQEEAEKISDNRLALELPPGCYRLLANFRKSDGNQLIRELVLALEEGQELPAQVCQHAMAAALEGKKVPLPDVAIKAQEGTKSLGEQSRGAKNICIWLEEGKEPTEHILNELLENSQKVSRFQEKIFLLKRSPVKEGGTLEKVMKALPGIGLWDAGCWEDSVQVAQLMEVEKNKYPLAVARDEEGYGLYATAGYNVGAVQLLIERIE